MNEAGPCHEITLAETYQIDSDEWDSDEEKDNLGDEEYDRLVEEAEDAFSEEEIQRMTFELKERGIVNFLRSYLATGKKGELASLRKLLLGFGAIPPISLRHPSTPNIELLPFTKHTLSRILRRRERLSHLNTVPDAINLLRNAKNIIVLSGAGISTSCGIPDFRSATGLYAQLQAEGKWELDDPQQMFDFHFFKEHPEVFFSFAKQIYPSNFTPSPCHRWIKLLEDRGVLLRNYTQNIDTLERLAGVTKVLQCHGSFATASCLRCKTRVPGQTIEPYIMSSQIPYCGTCRQKRETELVAIKDYKAASRKDKGKGKAKGWGSGTDDSSEVDEWGGGDPGIIKPDITFFGQALDSEFDERLFQDREEVDLLVIIGTSLKVAPVSEVLTHIPHSVPQIFINLTPVTHVQPDICLLGDADTIVTYLSHELGWEIPPPPAVVHSSTADSNVNIEKDTLPRISPVNCPPEKVDWLTAAGDLSHFHFLASSLAQINPLSKPENGQEEDHPDDDSDSSGGASPAVAKLDLGEMGPADKDETEGYVSDDEGDGRPLKRMREQI